MKKGRTRTPTGAQSSPPKRRRRAAHTILLFVGCVVIVEALFGDKGFMATKKAREDYRTLDGDISRARAENVRLRDEAQHLLGDARTIEELARRELGLIKPGEKLFTIKDVSPDEHRP